MSDKKKDDDEDIVRWTPESHLLLATLVSRSEDKRWGPISYALRHILRHHPPDWYTPRRCSSQYIKMVRGVKEKYKEFPTTNQEVTDFVLKHYTEIRLLDLDNAQKEFLKTARKFEEFLELFESGATEKEAEVFIAEMKRIDDDFSNLYKKMRQKRTTGTPKLIAAKPAPVLTKGKASAGKAGADVQNPETEQSIPAVKIKEEPISPTATETHAEGSGSTTVALPQTKMTSLSERPETAASSSEKQRIVVGTIPAGPSSRTELLPQPFFNPANLLSNASAGLFRVPSSSALCSNVLRRKSGIGSIPTSSVSTVSSVTLSAPTLSKLLEMPPSMPGKLPPLPTTFPKKDLISPVEHEAKILRKGLSTQLGVVPAEKLLPTREEILADKISDKIAFADKDEIKKNMEADEMAKKIMESYQKTIPTKSVGVLPTAISTSPIKQKTGLVSIPGSSPKTGQNTLLAKVLENVSTVPKMTQASSIVHKEIIDSSQTKESKTPLTMLRTASNLSKVQELLAAEPLTPKIPNVQHSDKETRSETGRVRKDDAMISVEPKAVLQKLDAPKSQDSHHFKTLKTADNKSPSKVTRPAVTPESSSSSQLPKTSSANVQKALSSSQYDEFAFDETKSETRNEFLSGPGSFRFGNKTPLKRKIEMNESRDSPLSSDVSSGIVSRPHKTLKVDDVSSVGEKGSNSSTKTSTEKIADTSQKTDSDKKSFVGLTSHLKAKHSADKSIPENKTELGKKINVSSKAQIQMPSVVKNIGATPAEKNIGSTPAVDIKPGIPKRDNIKNINAGVNVDPATKIQLNQELIVENPILMNAETFSAEVIVTPTPQTRTSENTMIQVISTTEVQPPTLRKKHAKALSGETIFHDMVAAAAQETSNSNSKDRAEEELLDSESDFGSLPSLSPSPFTNFVGHPNKAVKSPGGNSNFQFSVSSPSTISISPTCSRTSTVVISSSTSSRASPISTDDSPSTTSAAEESVKKDAAQMLNVSEALKQNTESAKTTIKDEKFDPTLSNIKKEVLNPDDSSECPVTPKPLQSKNDHSVSEKMSKYSVPQREKRGGRPVPKSKESLSKTMVESSLIKKEIKTEEDTSQTRVDKGKIVSGSSDQLSRRGRRGRPLSSSRKESFFNKTQESCDDDLSSSEKSQEIKHKPGKKQTRKSLNSSATSVDKEEGSSSQDSEKESSCDSFRKVINNPDKSDTEDVPDKKPAEFSDDGDSSFIKSEDKNVDLNDSSCASLNTSISEHSDVKSKGQWSPRNPERSSRRSLVTPTTSVTSDESDNSDDSDASSTKQPKLKWKDRAMEQQYKTWKKSISIVWREAACHKYANVFAQKVTDDVAPGYSAIVRRPMDLSLIKKNIDNGTIKTTEEFQRDMMLMFQNAIMYNNSDHDVYQMAVEMQRDVRQQIVDYLATQLIVEDKYKDPPVSSLRNVRQVKMQPKTPQRAVNAKSNV